MAPIAEKKNRPNLYLASYRYGDLIVDDGILRPPCVDNHDFKTAHKIEKDYHCMHCKGMWDEVSYPIPLTIVITKAIEVFDRASFKPKSGDKEEYPVPLRIATPGEVFGDFESLDHITLDVPTPPPSWNVSSGARSVYLQLSTGDTTFWANLEGCLGISPYSIPQAEGPGYNLIRYIIREYPEFPDWHTRILIVPTDWFNGSSAEKRRFQHLLYKEAWRKSKYQRYDLNRTAGFFEEVRTEFEERKDAEKCVPFLRYLLFAARGDLPAFKPSTSTTEVSYGPFSRVQEILHRVVDRWGNSYYPSIMQPAYLNTSDDVGYSSLRFLTFDSPFYNIKNFLTEYVEPIGSYFSRPRDRERKLKDFNLKDIRVFYNRSEKEKLYNRDIINEEYIDEFIPHDIDNKKIQPYDKSFLSSFVRFVRR